MRHPTPDEWKALVAEYEQSGLQQKEFVAKHDVSLGTFQYHLYRRSKSSKSSPTRVQRFLPVQVVASPAPQLARAGSSGVVEIGLQSGVLLRVAVGTDTRYVAELVSALG